MVDSLAAPGDTLVRARSLPPGAERITALHAIDPAGLGPAERLEMVELWEQCDYWLQAQKQRPLAALASTPTHGDERWCTWEIAAALRLAECTAHDRIDTAAALAGRLSRTLAALEAGCITYWQAHDIAIGTALLSDAGAWTVEDRVLDRARHQTRSETRRAVERAVLAVEPDAAEERRRRRRRERRIERPRPSGDGMSGTWMEGPTETMAGFFGILTALGREMKKSGNVGTVAAARFDIVMSLVFALGTGTLPAVPEVPSPPGPLPATVGLVVRQSAAAGDDDEPADLPGYGPIAASVARRIIAGLPDDASDVPLPGEEPVWDDEAEVTFTMLPVDPQTGWLIRPDDDRLDRGRDRRVASSRQRSYIADRDRVCFFPGCNRVAEHNDVDHRDSWAEQGRTDVDTMGSACPHHNRLTKNNGWSTIPGPDGTATLVSPLGRRYPITPHQYWDP